jgi:hypothetical protein
MLRFDCGDIAAQRAVTVDCAAKHLYSGVKPLGWLPLFKAVLIILFAAARLFSFKLTMPLGLISELRVCVLALKWARKADVKYPIEGVEQIVGAFPHARFQGGGHEITSDTIRSRMLNEYFPIQHEGELVSKVYLALMRCKAEAGQQSGNTEASEQNSGKETER